MSTDPHETPRPLPDRPNLRHLKDQAKDLLKSGAAKSVAAAQFAVARLYGFASWTKLKVHIDSLGEVGQLKRAIDSNDFERVKALMTRSPSLHRAPLGYGKNGPLTWVAECRVPWEAPTATRLAMARWMIENGSDVHQGGDGPLMRAALSGDRVAMMELLVSHGADVNAEWQAVFPIIFAPCEAVDPVALKWLVDHGANPNCDNPNREYPGTALDYVIGSYARSPQLGACIDILLEAGGITKYNVPVILDLLRGRLDRVAEHLDADPALLSRRFPELDFGTTGGRLLTLKGATLLHVAAEYQNLEATTLLLDRGADVNGRAAVDEAGVGGQTAIFHAVTQREDGGVPVARLLIERGADLSVRAKVPGHYERPGEVVECTALGYALRFQNEPKGPDKAKTVALLRERGAADFNLPQRAKNTAIGREWEGTWLGKLDFDGKETRLVLAIANQPDGTVTGTINVDEASEFQIVTITQGASGLTLVAGGGSYSGTLTPAGTELVGTLTQGQRVLPLTFRRAPAARAGRS